MTNFLTRLAQRTLGLAPVVQPRLASRYASVDEVMLDTTPTSVARAQPAIEELKGHQTNLEINNSINNPTNTPINNSTNDSINTLINNSTSPNLTESSTNHSSQTPQNNSTPLNTLVQPTATSAHPILNNAPLLPPQSVDVQETIAPALDERIESPQFSPSSSTVEPFTNALPQALKSSEQSPQIRASHSPLVPPPTVHLSPPPIETTIERETTIALPLVNLEAPAPIKFTAPPASPNHPTVSRPQATQPSKDSVIEVRIGRIEVRSTPSTPPKPRAKSTPVTPALSLSDYLNQRDGGRS